MLVAGSKKNRNRNENSRASVEDASTQFIQLKVVGQLSSSRRMQMKNRNACSSRLFHSRQVSSFPLGQHVIRARTCQKCCGRSALKCTHKLRIYIYMCRWCAYCCERLCNSRAGSQQLAGPQKFKFAQLQAGGACCLSAAESLECLLPATGRTCLSLCVSLCVRKLDECAVMCRCVDIQVHKNCRTFVDVVWAA